MVKVPLIALLPERTIVPVSPPGFGLRLIVKLPAVIRALMVVVGFAEPGSWIVAPGARARRPSRSGSAIVYPDELNVTFPTDTA